MDYLQLEQLQYANYIFPKPFSTSGKGKCKDIQFAIEITTPLWELKCHKGSHSVTCHPAAVTFPPFMQFLTYRGFPRKCSADHMTSARCISTYNELISSNDIQLLTCVFTFAIKLQNLHKSLFSRLVILRQQHLHCFNDILLQ